MAQLSSLETVIDGADKSGEKVGRLAGFGSIIGIIAAVFGLLIGKALIPMSSIQWEVVSELPLEWILGGDPLFPTYVAIFMALMAVSQLLRSMGSKDLGGFLGSGFGNVSWIGFIVAAALALIIPTQLASIRSATLIPGFLTVMYFLGAIFVLVWQLGAVIYTDSSKTWVGFLAGMLNALFIPVLAIGHALSPILVYAAYGILLAGQVMSLLFWWSPFSTIREYARSTDTAKLAFGLTGVLTFVVGLVAIIAGPLGFEETVSVWYPWSTLVNETTYRTNPVLVFGLLSLMIYWIMLAPRLGKRELKAAHIGEDIIKGGNKALMLFLAFIGIISAAQAGAMVEGVGSWGFFLVMGPAGIMFVMGAAYTARTDIVTGLPLVIAAVFLMIHPFVLQQLVLIPWLLIILTQVFLMFEIKWRGHNGFSQAALTVIISLAASVAIILFMLGGFGSGPLALWPANRWFNITLIPGIPAIVQGPTIIALPLLALLLRNVSLAGYSYGRGYTTGGVLMGASIMFAFMIPAIAGNESVSHEANTGAALLLALYSISLMLVMSLNLNLANDVEEKGRSFEGTLIKVGTLAGLIAAAFVIIAILIVFAGTPTPTQIAQMVSVMVIFVVSSELLSITGWLIAGVQLGMLKQGFKLTRPEK